MAFRYLSWILFPLLGCYAVYSLLYLEHKGWYSWLLSMLYGFLLTFGERTGEQALSSVLRPQLGSSVGGTTQGGPGWHTGASKGYLVRSGVREASWRQVRLGPHPRGNPHSKQADRRPTARDGCWEGVRVRVHSRCDQEPSEGPKAACA